MALYEHVPHPHIAAHKAQAPPQTTDERVGFNGHLAMLLTGAVGTMWAAYLFALLALVVLPQAVQGGMLTLVQWISQTFIQLVMLSVIVVGQNILGRTSDKRAIQTYDDAEAILHEAEAMQDHLIAQDKALERLIAEMTALKEKGQG